MKEITYESLLADDGVNAHWAVWRAAEAAAIERCARECDDLEKLALEDMALEDDGRFGVYAKKYRLAARRIRALAKGESP